MRLKVPSDIALLIRGAHPHLKRKIRAGLKRILENPSEGKPLRFELEGLRSFRIGSFRIIYKVHRDILDVVAVGPRTRIYEETYRIVAAGTVEGKGGSTWPKR